MSAIRATVRDTVTLSNELAEHTLVGSLLIDGKVFAAFCDQVNPDWFADELARLYFEAGMQVHRAGSAIAPVSVIARLPDGREGLGRAELAKLYLRLTDSSVPPAQIPAVMDVVRDRWARRTLYGVGNMLAKEADKFDLDPFALSGELAATIEAINGSRAAVEASTIDQSIDDTLARLERKDVIAGPTTGLAAIDEKLNGYKPGQLYVIAARPAMGKSAFAISSLLKTALAGHGVLFFSLEMTDEEVSARALADIMDNTTMPPYSAIMRGNVKDEHIPTLKGARDRLKGLPFFVDYSPSLTVKEIASRARRKRQEWAENGLKLDVVLVDHLTEIAPSQRYAGNPVMEVSENVKALRVLAKELDCCVVALCQLSREVEKRPDKKPQLSDLRWTGEIEQAAHVVAFLYREYYYAKDNPETDPWQLMELASRMDFLVRKNRQGETGDIRLQCSMPHSSVRNAV